MTLRHLCRSKYLIVNHLAYLCKNSFVWLFNFVLTLFGSIISFLPAFPPWNAHVFSQHLEWKRASHANKSCPRILCKSFSSRFSSAAPTTDSHPSVSKNSVFLCPNTLVFYLLPSLLVAENTVRFKNNPLWIFRWPPRWSRWLKCFIITLQAIQILGEALIAFSIVAIFHSLVFIWVSRFEKSFSSNVLQLLQSIFRPFTVRQVLQWFTGIVWKVNNTHFITVFFSLCPWELSVSLHFRFLEAIIFSVQSASAYYL